MQFTELYLQEIGDAQYANFARLFLSQQLFKGTQPPRVVLARPMQQITIQIIQAQQSEALIQSAHRFVILRRPYLGKHKQLFPRKAAVPQGFPHSILIMIVGGRINIAIPAGHGLAHGQRQLRPRSLVTAEAETGHIRSVMQLHCGGNIFDHMLSPTAPLRPAARTVLPVGTRPRRNY